MRKVNRILIIEKIREKINQYLISDKEHKNRPNFKEGMGDKLMSEKTVSLLQGLMPQLTDDDYFLDKSDSLVYSYLMSDKSKKPQPNGKLKRETKKPEEKSKEKPKGKLKDIQKQGAPKKNLFDNLDFDGDTPKTSIKKHPSKVPLVKPMIPEKAQNKSIPLQKGKFFETKNETEKPKIKKNSRTFPKIKESVPEKEKKKKTPLNIKKPPLKSLANLIHPINSTVTPTNMTISNSTDLNLTYTPIQINNPQVNTTKQPSEMDKLIKEIPKKPDSITPNSLFNPHTPSIPHASLPSLSSLPSITSLASIDDLRKPILFENYPKIKNQTKTLNCLSDNFDKQNKIIAKGIKQPSIFEMDLNDENDTLTSLNNSCLNTTNYNISIVYIKTDKNITSPCPNDECEKKRLNVTNTLKNDIKDSENMKKMLIKYLIKRRSRLEKLKKSNLTNDTQTYNNSGSKTYYSVSDAITFTEIKSKKKPNDILPPIFSQDDFSKVKTLRRKGENQIKKMYEEPVFVETKSFIKPFRKKQFLPENQIYSNYHVNLIADVNFPHYGNIGEQVFFGKVPNYENKFYTDMR
jgi:hypothetical protein